MTTTDERYIRQKIEEVISYGAEGFYSIMFSVSKLTGIEMERVLEQINAMEQEGLLELGAD